MSRLGRCLNPDSIAVVGGREAARVIDQCRRFGFTGEIHAIHPNESELAGISCVTDVSELRESVDAAFIAIPAELTVAAVEQLSTQQAGGVVCYASGFGETGEDDRHERFLQAAADMPVVGPNCYGYINALNGAVLWPDQHGLARVEEGVGIFSGSGNLCVNISMHKRGLPIALLVSVGNQAVVGLEECLEMAIDDERITAIGLHIEGVKNLPKFCAQAKRAAEAGKPVVALKTGRSEMGAQIAMSHTASLAGSAELYDCLFRRLGIAQVGDLESFLETLKLVSVSGRLPGNRLLSLSCSGGEASLVADLSQEMNIELPAFDESLAADIRKTLNELVTVSNPFDYHTFIWGDYDRLFATFRESLRAEVDLAMLLLDVPDIEGCENEEWVVAADAFADACEANNRRGAVVSCLAESMPESVMQRLTAAGISPILGLRQALTAIEAAASVCRMEGDVEICTEHLLAGETEPVDEFTSKRELAAQGLPVPAQDKATSSAEALKAAKKIGYPVALKVSGFAHKTEVQGVSLDIRNDDDLVTEAERLLALDQEILVEEMVTGALAELLVGVNYDPQFGHHLVLGFGGTLVELIADREVLLLPATNDQIEAAIARLKTAPLLLGYRGKPAADMQSVVSAVRSVINYLERHRAEVREIDINPLIVTASGAIAADALIIRKQP